MSNKAASKGNRFSTSLIVGMLLVPLSAVAAVALINPDASAELEETAAAEVIVEETTTTAAQEFEMPEIASAADLKDACGEQGLLLVTKEAEGSISPLEQAALDSLRAICTSEGMDLPGPPAPDAIVETVTVVAAASGSTSSASSSDSAAAEFEEEYAETVAHINAAIADGAQGEMIDLARQLVSEAAALADAGDYDGGMAKLDSARDAADQADRGGHHDDDDDDHDDDDDEEEDEDEEDDDDDDDEDDD